MGPIRRPLVLHAFHEDAKPGDLSLQFGTRPAYRAAAYSVCRTALRGHQGAIATPQGDDPTVTVAVTVLVEMSITDTLFEGRFVT